MQPYLTIPFQFDDDNLSWFKSFIQPIVEDYQLNAPENGALVSFSTEQMLTLRTSKIWQEVLRFAQQHQLATPWPQLFIYKRLDRPRDIAIGNPHIDTAGPDGISVTVPVRLNILIQGEDSTEMVWWNCDRKDPRVEQATFTRPDLTRVGRLQIRGHTLIERWENLGEPDHRARHLAKYQEYASFVRTDIVHALNWTGAEPRVIFSIKFQDNSWDDISLVAGHHN
jgi:hypothetical protein